MNEKQRTRASRFLSLVLRHEPQKIGLALDESGWANVDQLLTGCRDHGIVITRPDLEEIVATNEKKRFSFSEDGHRIRANQGHSVDVELGYTATPPPSRLYHGTATRFVESIRTGGLEKGERHHVHLSSEQVTAHNVGQRHGAPVVLTIRADAMQQAGYQFYLSANGVWLTDFVPAEFIEFFTNTKPVSGVSKRSSRARLAQETVSICEAGNYQTGSGRTINIKETLDYSKAHTHLYSLESVPKPALREAPYNIIEVTDESTFQAIQRIRAQTPECHLACLNFASAKNPGGGFLGGSQAQEESLARSSTLYPCLLTQPTYYERNRANRSAIYLDLAIFSPDVLFFRDDEGNLLDSPVKASVITAPAPNAGAIAANESAKISEIVPALNRRAELVLDIAAANKVTHLVLGAWGCGVFRNEPSTVAHCFAHLLRDDARYRNAFTSVVFAVLDRTADQATLEAFRKAFS